jgi:radical SAM protein with 4Fe4S-binding SPASM domain
VKVSEYLHFLPVEKDIYVGWNRYFPSIFILNRSALQIFDDIKNQNRKALKSNKELNQYLEKFKKYKFVFEGKFDPSREDFLRMVQDNLEQPDRMAAQFYKQKQDYEGLKIVNDDCNLNCSYCINRYSAIFPGPKTKEVNENKLGIINRCIDQFFSRKIENRVYEAKIFFNGGEILIEWELIKKIVRRISGKYKGIKVDYGINTNLTLLTEEMARFFSRHNFRVMISIDGYREAHEKTRKYHDGSGSFDDIIQKVNLFRKYNKKNSLNVFQGTLEHIEDFQPEEVYNMSRYDFVSARLAPNLLNASEDDARKKAQLMGKFLLLNSGHDFQVTELIFTRSRDKINQEEYRYSFNCRGLCALPRMGIEINLSTLSLSHLCGFIPKAALPFAKLNYDIYNPKLWEASYAFIKERMESLLNHCMECPLIGICAGGCILSGLDNENRLNKAACLYQKEMWEIYVKKAYKDSKQG